MRLLILFLSFSCFCVNADFSFDGVKKWFKDLYSKSAVEIESKVESLKDSSAGKRVSDLIDESKTTWKESRKGVMTNDFLKVRQSFLNCTKKLHKELDSSVHSLKQLEDIQYHDTVVIYEDGKSYVIALEKYLSEELSTLSDMKKMKKAANENMENIMDILVDNLIFPYVNDLREQHELFNKACEKLEKDLNK